MIEILAQITAPKPKAFTAGLVNRLIGFPGSEEG